MTNKPYTTEDPYPEIPAGAVLAMPLPNGRWGLFKKVLRLRIFDIELGELQRQCPESDFVSHEEARARWKFLATPPVTIFDPNNPSGTWAARNEAPHPILDPRKRSGRDDWMK